MRLGRVLYQRKVLSVLFSEDKVYPLVGSIFDEPKVNGKGISLLEVKILPPVTPSKIIALGLNYRDHARELNLPLPEEPLIFMKPPSAVIGPEENILLPPESKRVDYEAELAVVIGKKARRISPEEAMKVILGFTCFNDVTARDLQQKDAQWTRAKSFDTFAPIGPWVETELDLEKVRVRAYLNGELRQDSSLKELVFPVPQVVSFVSQIMTLYPGDVIATGTPPGIGPLSPGDVIDIEITGVGKLKNYVTKEI
ncbi:5-carboxymethyl-2-hydroxymuconateDelta-isomerase [Thermodesulfatator indicus DSM 15286]|uniref:5-carboxymethyl-2-hydroxymuconateDelta-isomerase n=1 Tax=Thermodesulfatator indicus (strain DSM 15286 / JCM 11887 / CIR29812) TaxID=667014 RepID=F8AB97_THEID|nr:fumarylacetoacetate hydrolase family protein [Thermodesulfatator indicus]AEH45555.1 5-carboxymethyl-2-hydroxymuconateDelta-isomerase [Thermodesulfatator indicus DSM 15286]